MPRLGASGRRCRPRCTIRRRASGHRRRARKLPARSSKNGTRATKPRIVSQTGRLGAQVASPGPSGPCLGLADPNVCLSRSRDSPSYSHQTLAGAEQVIYPGSVSPIPRKSSSCRRARQSSNASDLLRNFGQAAGVVLGYFNPEWTEITVNCNCSAGQPPNHTLETAISDEDKSAIPAITSAAWRRSLEDDKVVCRRD